MDNSLLAVRDINHKHIVVESEGHTIIQKGRKNIRYYVKDYETFLFDLK